jgi:hypothetical protein
MVTQLDANSFHTDYFHGNFIQKNYAAGPPRQPTWTVSTVWVKQNPLKRIL